MCFHRYFLKSIFHDKYGLLLGDGGARMSEILTRKKRLD